MLDNRKNIKHQNTDTKKPKWVVLLVTFVVACVFLAGTIFWISSTVKSPNSNLPDKKIFVVTEGQSLDEITNELKSQGLIKNKFVFGLYLKYKGLAGSVQTGQYNVPMNLNMIDLASVITTGKIVTGKITIPEGWTNNQIGDYLEKNTKITKVDFLEAAKYSPERDKYEFLSELKEGDSLEGFLYPDTYQVSLEPTADEIVEKMLYNFDKKLTNPDRDQIEKSGMTTHEVVTLASIVEREVAKAEDRVLVASVFLNRLNIGMPLESCATIQYITGENKKQFTYEETRVPSPYNSYVNKGLPPGPIGNPSIESIRAVIYPQESDYIYFLSADGVTYFSKTLDEHNAKKAKYL